jgi:hypothetical protein
MPAKSKQTASTNSPKIGSNKEIQTSLYDEASVKATLKSQDQKSDLATKSE